MTTNEDDAASGVARMAHIEALLASYPDVTGDELEILKNWFNREASAFDVATLASKSEIRSGYTQFRADHIDKFGTRDIVLGIIGVLAVCALIALIAYMI